MNHLSTRSFIAYLRVSTARQEVQGVSLSEQRKAISDFASARGYAIRGWHIEVQSAATTGRKVFKQVISQLHKEKGLGLLLHRIDRGARNLWDWAEIGSLIDQGIPVHFVHDGLDLNSRGGRLAADIQAVVAADYVRNLRDETIKGIHGRFRQGLIPFAAPLGYIDCGGGRPKALDPQRAGLVREIFNLYASGSFTLKTLQDEITTRGLVNKNNGLITRTSLSRLLRNRFYAGEVYFRRTNEIFTGLHEPLITLATFNQVQAVLRSRKRSTHWRSEPLLWSRRAQCVICQRHLVGETKKGHVYYRCHSKACAGVCIREEVLTEHFLEVLPEDAAAKYLELNDDEARRAFLNKTLLSCAVYRRRISMRIQDAQFESPMGVAHLAA